MKKNIFRLLIQGWLILSLAGCMASESTTDSGAPSSAEERGSRSGRRSSEIDRTRPLINHLRQMPGLLISPDGGDFRVQLRGSQSITGPNNVMFAVNGVPVGTSYSQTTNLFSMENVKEIRLYNSAEALARFGERGAYGVIDILTD